MNATGYSEGGQRVHGVPQWTRTRLRAQSPSVPVLLLPLPPHSISGWLSFRAQVTCYLCRKAFPDHLLWRKPSSYSLSHDITFCQYFFCVYLFPYVLLSHCNRMSMRIPPYFFSPLYFLILIQYFLEHSRSWAICVEWKNLKATLYCSIAVWPWAR